MGCFQPKSYSNKSPLPPSEIQSYIHSSSMQINQTKNKEIAEYAINNKI